MNLLICPLKKEMKIILNYFAQQGITGQQIHLGRMSALELKRNSLLMAFSGHGKEKMISSLQFLLEKQPLISRVICVGSGGALSNKININDQVIANMVIELNGPNFQTDSDLLRIFSTTSSGKFKIHTGSIVSCHEDINDSNKAEEIARLTGALAVGQEGTAAASVCQSLKKPFIEIRAVTDRASEDLITDFASNLKKSMENCAQLLLEKLI